VLYLGDQSVFFDQTWKNVKRDCSSVGKEVPITSKMPFKLEKDRRNTIAKIIFGHTQEVVGVFQWFVLVFFVSLATDDLSHVDKPDSFPLLSCLVRCIPQVNISPSYWQLVSALLSNNMECHFSL
jgi:hypothetical protein